MPEENQPAVTPRDESRSLMQRVLAVMAEVPYIKNDKLVEKQGYTVATYDQIIAHVRPLLVKYGIVIGTRQVGGVDRATVVNGREWVYYTGKYEVDFINADKPEEVYTIPVEASALDNGDKAPGKAMTYGTKAAIKKMFSLETGDDDESRAPGTGGDPDDPSNKPEPIKQPQAKSAPKAERPTTTPKEPRTGKPITSGQVKFLERKIEDANLKLADVVKKLGVKTLADITDANWKDAVAACSKAA